MPQVSNHPFAEAHRYDFDVAKLRIYLQSAKQIAAFFERKDILMN